MSTDTNSTASTEPLNITGVLIALADLRNDLELPQPIGLRMAKSNGIATVEVATFGAVMAWADALGAPQNARHSSVFKSGAATHSAWAEWNGWHLRVAAYVDAPEAPAFVSEHAVAVAP